MKMGDFAINEVNYLRKNGDIAILKCKQFEECSDYMESSMEYTST